MKTESSNGSTASGPRPNDLLSRSARVFRLRSANNLTQFSFGGGKSRGNKVPSIKAKRVPDNRPVCLHKDRDCGGEKYGAKASVSNPNLVHFSGKASSVKASRAGCPGMTATLFDNKDSKGSASAVRSDMIDLPRNDKVTSTRFNYRH